MQAHAGASDLEPFCQRRAPQAVDGLTAHVKPLHLTHLSIFAASRCCVHSFTSTKTNTFTMLQLILSFFTLLLLSTVAVCQSEDRDGYTGYKLDIRQDGDPLAVGYETENTKNNVSVSFPAPDVFLNVYLFAIGIEP